MFLQNTHHLQGSLLDPEQNLNSTLRGVLKNNWSQTFYEKIFKNINEKDFRCLYHPVFGRSNFPVNILVAIEIIKEMYSLTDEQLYENYQFNYLYQKVLGVDDINRYSFAIRTMYHFRENYCEYEERTGINLFDRVFQDGRDAIIEELGLKNSTQRIDSVMRRISSG
ncbi:MAG: transposase [Leptospiraceae bacterium]|nr:transposase [Leptospiraceae bacterium]